MARRAVQSVKHVLSDCQVVAGRADCRRGHRTERPARSSMLAAEGGGAVTLIDELVQEMRVVLAGRSDQIRAMIQSTHLFEAWFCVEFLLLLDHLLETKRIDVRQHAFPVPGGSVDFCVRREAEDIALEFKAFACWTGGSQPTTYLVRSKDGTG